MSYVENSLSNGEVIKLHANVSWWSQWFNVLLCIILMPIFVGFILLLYVILRVRGTEFAATDKRIIAKTGIIARRTYEINLTKVESIQVDQGIFGRFLNYGTIIVSGTGVTTAKIPSIDDPMIFKRRLQEIVENAQNHRINIQNTNQNNMMVMGS